MRLGPGAHLPFDVLLATGTYDVSFELDRALSACIADANGLPCVGGELGATLTVNDAPGEIALDIHPRTYRLRLAPDATYPEVERLFSLHCRDDNHALGAARGAREWSFAALPTQCVLVAFESGCRERTCEGERFEGEVEFDPARLEPTVALRRVKLSVRLDSAITRGATSVVGRSELVFVPTAAPDYGWSTARVESSDTLSADVPPGTYDVRWRIAADRGLGDNSGGELLVARALRIDRDSTVQITLPTIAKRVDVFAPVPSTPAPPARIVNAVGYRFADGHLWFSHSSASELVEQESSVSFDTLAPIAATSVLHTVTVRATGSTTSETPITAAMLQASAPIVLRTPIVRATPTLLVDGAPVPLSTVRATGLDASRGIERFAESFTLDRETFVFPGVRDVIFGPRDENDLASVRGVALGALTVSESGATIDVRSLRVRARILLNGAPAPHDELSTPFIVFDPRVPSVVRQTFAQRSLGPLDSLVDRTEFERSLVSQEYSVRWSQGPCASSDRPTRLCGTVVLHGCAVR